MSGDMDAAKRQAFEDGNCWEDIESAWKRGWIDGNWGDERQAKFEAEWEEACARTRQPADGAEGRAPTNKPQLPRSRQSKRQKRKKILHRVLIGVLLNTRGSLPASSNARMRSDEVVQPQLIKTAAARKASTSSNASLKRSSKSSRHTTITIG